MGGNISYFLYGMIFVKFFKILIFYYMEMNIIYVVLVVEENGDFGMVFNLGNGIDNNGFRYGIDYC